MGDAHTDDVAEHVWVGEGDALVWELYFGDLGMDSDCWGEVCGRKAFLVSWSMKEDYRDGNEELRLEIRWSEVDVSFCYIT